MSEVHRIKRLQRPRRARRRMFHRLSDCAVPGLAPICLDSNDQETVVSGYQKRLLRPVPEADESLLREFECYVDKYLEENVPRARQVTFEEWIEGAPYNRARKRELWRAWEALKGGRPTRKQCEKIQSFVKSEPYSEWKHCRLINSRSDYFKVFSGPYFKAIEEVVYGLPEFIKHVPVPERPAKIRALRRAMARYYQTDFTAFESHFTERIMQACEIRLYRHCLNWTSDVEVICRALMGINRMCNPVGVSVTCRARRMSGDMCTSLGNGFTNLMLAKFLAARQGKEIEGFVEGDDGLFATEADLRTEDYAKLGFTIKIDEVADPCEASFCGMIFSDTGDIIRDPARFCATFGWSSSCVGAGWKVRQELLRAKALSACYETPQCPIVGALARRGLEVTRDCTPRFVEDGYHTIPKDQRGVKDFAPSWATRELFARTYGIPPASQMWAEEQIAAGNYDILSVFPPDSLTPYLEYSTRYVELG